MLGLIGVAGLLMTLTLGLGAAVAARHRAAAAADLAALAAIDSREGCPAASRIALANGARLANCEIFADGSVKVTVMVEVPGLARDAQGKARAGPGPAQTSPVSAERGGAP
jgi:secretion/DNA translocation related TadE-like protein